MNILYTGISAKYIHTMPAGWFLAEFLHSKGIEIDEIYHNVNEPYNKIIEDIVIRQPEMLLLSVYIFNVELIKKIIIDIREVLPNCIIVAGGPEVTEDFEADHIIIGEGELAIYKLIKDGGDKIVRESQISDLDTIPSPYTIERLRTSANKLIYYESSRGCPFKCSYCMAGQIKGVRYFSLDRLKSDLISIVDSGAKIIKFTDRTFNANIKRARAILQFILDTFKDSNVCFHLEVGGDLFDNETLLLLKSVPNGLIQMEAGVQTLNPLSLKAIDREFNIDKFKNNIKSILDNGNIHMHLDLIAGLPYDSLHTFKASFNEVIALRPHMLQLGFLKLLKGTRIREDYKVDYDNVAPYEVISTPTMTIDDFKELKKVEWITDRIYNSGKFFHTLNYLFQIYNPYDLFLAIAEHMNDIGANEHSQENDIYNGMLLFMKNIELAKDLLRFDYLITNNSKILPNSLKNEHSKEFRKFLAQNKPSQYVIHEEIKYLPIEQQIGKYIVKFDYSDKNKVNGQYNYNVID